jgi:hypothetical protein
MNRIDAIALVAALVSTGALLANIGVWRLQKRLDAMTPVRDGFAQSRIDTLRDDLDETVRRLERMADCLTKEPALRSDYVDVVAIETDDEEN